MQSHNMSTHVEPQHEYSCRAITPNLKELDMRRSIVTSSLPSAYVAALCFAPAHCNSVQAEPVARAVQTLAATTALAIPVLPGARVQLELDANEKDLLGMVKSLVKGLEKSNAKAGKSDQILLRLLADKQFSSVLKDIHHLHVVVYDRKEPESDLSATLNRLSSGGMTLDATTITGSMTEGVRIAPPVSVAPAPDVFAFYEKPFRAEGGRRVLKADMKSTQVEMFGFQPGFALVINSPSRLIVARADAFPDMEALGRMIEFTTSVAPTSVAPKKNVPKNTLKAPIAKQ